MRPASSGFARPETTISRLSYSIAGDEGRVDARVDAGPDRRAVLVAAVVVGGDVAGGDVAVLADVGVADVGEVRDLRARADLGVLDLDKRAGLGLRVQVGAGAQVG